jgi:hypothetical protein
MILVFFTRHQLPATRYCRFPLVTPESRQREGEAPTAL